MIGIVLTENENLTIYEGIFLFLRHVCFMLVNRREAQGKKASHIMQLIFTSSLKIKKN
jgi:hypothetical protein